MVMVTMMTMIIMTTTKGDDDLTMTMIDFDDGDYDGAG